MHDAIIKLKRLKNKIEKMPDNYQKTLLVTNYFVKLFTNPFVYVMILQ